MPDMSRRRQSVPGGGWVAPRAIMADLCAPCVGRIIVCLGILVVGLASCASPLPQVAEDASAPTVRGEAILGVARTGDRGSVANLVEELDSDDVLYRWLAIRSLVMVTGQDLGYRYDAPVDEREAAVQRWVAWTREQGLAGSTEDRGGAGR